MHNLKVTVKSNVKTGKNIDAKKAIYSNICDKVGNAACILQFHAEDLCETKNNPELVPMQKAFDLINQGLKIIRAHEKELSKQTRSVKLVEPSSTEG